MKRKNSMLIKLGLLLTLLAINVMAATPGTTCTIRARTLLGLTITVSGVVSSNRNTCRPLSVPPLLEALSTGVRCGAIDTIPGVLYYTVSCPY